MNLYSPIGPRENVHCRLFRDRDKASMNGCLCGAQDQERKKKSNGLRNSLPPVDFCKRLGKQTVTGHGDRMEHNKLRLDQVFSYVSSKLVTLDDLDAAEATVHKNTRDVCHGTQRSEWAKSRVPPQGYLIFRWATSRYTVNGR